LSKCVIVFLIHSFIFVPAFTLERVTGSADLEGLETSHGQAGPALADAGPKARPGRGAPLSSDFMTSSCSVNRVTIVIDRRYTVQC